MALQSSQRLPELQFYTKKSYRILQLQFQLQILQGYPYIIHIHIQPTHAHYNPENSPSSIQNPIPHSEDRELFEYYYIQRAKRPSFQKRNSTHRRQGDLLEIHPCVLTRPSKDIPVFSVLPRYSSRS